MRKIAAILSVVAGIAVLGILITIIAVVSTNNTRALEQKLDNTIATALIIKYK